MQKRIREGLQPLRREIGARVLAGNIRQGELEAGEVEAIGERGVALAYEVDPAVEKVGECELHGVRARTALTFSARRRWRFFRMILMPRR